MVYTSPTMTGAPTVSYVGSPAPAATTQYVTATGAAFQPVQVGPSGSWMQSGTGGLSQHYYGAMTVDGGYQVPPGLFHDPNVINTNLPGVAGTQFVLGPAVPQTAPLTTQTLPTPAPAEVKVEAKKDVVVAKKKSTKKKKKS